MKRLKGLNCILLVDDDDVSNYLNKILIEQSGIEVEVRVALNGLRALEYIVSARKFNKTKLNPDLIFLDLNMPRMNGWEFLDEYKKLNDYKDRGVIAMLTSSYNADDMNTALNEYQLPAYIYKPLTLKKLEEILYEHFPLEDKLN